MVLPQNLITIEVRHRDFCRGHKVEIIPCDHIHLVFLVGELAGSRSAGAVYQKWGEYLGVPICCCFVQKKTDERPLELRTPADIHREARTRDLRPPCEIDHMKLLHQLPVRQRPEVDRRWFTPGHNDFIVSRCRPDGDGGMRNIRNLEKERMQLFFNALEVIVHHLDLVSNGAHFCDHRMCVFSLRFHSRHVRGNGVLPALQGFHRLQQMTSLLVESERFIHPCGVLPFLADPLFDEVPVFPNESDVEHTAFVVSVDRYLACRRPPVGCAETGPLSPRRRGPRRSWFLNTRRPCSMDEGL